MSEHFDHKPKKLFYEDRPGIYLILGILCIVFGFRNWLLLASGTILIICAAYVFRMRKKYRGPNS